jgi:pyrimidine-nucleoside phosphorylase/thymidine phosphorylase
MRAVDIIHRKRLGEELSREEIAFMISGLTNGTIPDYQISAFLMAVFFAGMTEQETAGLTEEMLHSGSIVDLSDIPGEKVDKHSTGGVGDKTSLVIAPLAAAGGVTVPMISGRGLGHSGGTLDKLESIPGFDVGLDLKRFQSVLDSVGCAIIGQTQEIAPDDRKLYSLRDVTATIDSVPLITGSILSKKLAEGISGLVLDVKVGSGAFMKNGDSAKELATKLNSTARRMGVRSVAVLTDMNQPLGTHVGNALEVKESVDTLRGEGAEDLKELCLILTAHMLVLGNVAPGVEEGKKQAARLIETGAGFEKLMKMVELQGGDPRAIEDPNHLAQSAHQMDIHAPRDGYVARIETETLGTAAMLLGAGRETVDDVIDPAVGLVVHQKIGDYVSKDESLMTLHYNSDARLDHVRRLVSGAFVIGDSPPTLEPLIQATLEPEDNEP